MQFRTFGWIARQNPHIRLTESETIDDNRFIFSGLKGKSVETPVKERKDWFKKGELWPTLILVEKAWDEETGARTEHSFVRIFRHEDGAILDILVALSMDTATLLAHDFKVPLFSVTCSRKGTRGTAQRIHMDIL
ncbi:hypothetical protein CEE45_02425 [Candidatus Heimdallarchaeota archaeon B3_Heim]|nr:MAG: hypothetical protein CEE45_02425 [Candidatus Heimdallarchaeota archaeon B3_Heim]